MRTRIKRAYELSVCPMGFAISPDYRVGGCAREKNAAMLPRLCPGMPAVGWRPMCNCSASIPWRSVDDLRR
ncbi:hypothetical protein CW360_03585 [Pseudomonas fluvialis]|uniref:Uncharacterized protein n=1 Tax=Pseudomonas fluvialis TaxID=1793966 RepID=A0A2I0CTY8_9PSED|nr:hypothetical protein CW360_03585 [Pseudomonas pharmacofabricae]